MNHLHPNNPSNTPFSLPSAKPPVLEAKLVCVTGVSTDTGFETEIGVAVFTLIPPALAGRANTAGCTAGAATPAMGACRLVVGGGGSLIYHLLKWEKPPPYTAIELLCIVSPAG